MPVGPQRQPPNLLVPVQRCATLPPPGCNVARATVTIGNKACAGCLTHAAQTAYVGAMLHLKRYQFSSCLRTIHKGKSFKVAK